MRKAFSLSRLGLVFAALLSTVVAVGSPADAARRPSTYEVTVYNVTDSQYLTPPNWAGHSPKADVFSFRKVASPGVQAVAENGGVPILAAELQRNIDSRRLGVSGVATGPDPENPTPIAPGESRTFTFETTRGRFSLVSMIICTNDGFGGLDSRGLPTRVGQTKNFRLRGFDAGTEVNTEMRKDLVGVPFCGEGMGTGESNPDLAENGVIRFHKTLRGVGDLNPDLDWRGPVGKVSITRVG